MIRRILTLSLPIFLVLTLMFPTNSMAITAEDRLIEVERQLQAIAEQISNYEGQLTDLENAILENDKDLQQVNQELAEVQSRLSAAERELEKALENYDGTLNDLAEVQQTIVQEQTKLGKIKNEISDVSDELFETQKNLVEADDKLQEQAVSLYINGVMSPTTALFVELNELSRFLVALGYASTIVDSAYEIVEQLNALKNLASTQTVFLTEREEEREEEEQKSSFVDPVQAKLKDDEATTSTFIVDLLYKLILLIPASYLPTCNSYDCETFGLSLPDDL